LGRILRGWREENALSQEAFAREADLDRTYVGSVERGETNLSFEGVWQFLHALGRSWADLGAALDREPTLRARPRTRTARRGTGA
jgi:transcriptional regulator with XRE-family HTH domain